MMGLRLTTNRVNNYIHRLAFKLLPEVCLAVINTFMRSKFLQQDTSSWADKQALRDTVASECSGNFQALMLSSGCAIPG